MTAPRIALLDNDSSFLSLMHALLTGEGYRTLRCRPDDVMSAHALVKRARPALVILDLWLAKHEDGWAFLTHLWGDSETAQIPALIVTGEPVLLPMHAAVLHARHCMVVRKPFDRQDLLTAIAWLGVHDATADSEREERDYGTRPMQVRIPLPNARAEGSRGLGEVR